MVYYIVELSDLVDNLTHSVLVNENNLANFVSGYDAKVYKLINVYGIGHVSLDFKDFLAKEKGLETG